MNENGNETEIEDYYSRYIEPALILAEAAVKTKIVNDSLTSELPAEDADTKDGSLKNEDVDWKNLSSFTFKDSNKDGKISAQDFSKVKSHILGTTKLTQQGEFFHKVYVHQIITLHTLDI